MPLHIQGSVRLGRPVFAGYDYSSQGSAVPDDLPTCGRFKGLQRAINAYWKKYMDGSQPLTVDGQIGAKTLAYYQQAFANAIIRTNAPGTTYGSISELANNASVVATTMALAAGSAPNLSSIGGKACPGTGGATTPVDTDREQELVDDAKLFPEEGNGLLWAGLGLLGLGALLWLRSGDDEEFE